MNAAVVRVKAGVRRGRSADALNRLELAETWINGTNTRDLNYHYNALGNIESKTGTLPGDTDVTGYSYGGGGGSGPHAVTSVTVGGVFNTLSYDANGAVIRYDIAGTTEDKWLAYNVANQPTKIVIGSSLTDTTPQVSEQFRYDPDGRRYARRSQWQEGGLTHQEHVSYVGNVEIVSDTSDGEVLWVYKTRLNPSVMHVTAEWLGLIDGQPHSWNESHFEYAHRDHLGSIQLVTDDSGAELHRLAFEPFGSRRSKDWSGSIALIELNTLLARGQGHAPRVRGFTGHEHLDRTGFIHMNGRIYDPLLGRFLSPDPFVQFPTSSQNWNRYSYIDNKPNSFTDPSGYFQEISGVEGGTNEDGYGGSGGSGSWTIYSDCVPMDRGGCVLSPFPDSARHDPGASVSAPGFAGPSTDGPGVGEIDVDVPPTDPPNDDITDEEFDRFLKKSYQVPAPFDFAVYPRTQNCAVADACIGRINEISKALKDSPVPLGRPIKSDILTALKRAGLVGVAFEGASVISIRSFCEIANEQNCIGPIESPIIPTRELTDWVLEHLESSSDVLK